MGILLWRVLTSKDFIDRKENKPKYIEVPLSGMVMIGMEKFFPALAFLQHTV